ncbi:hypothetical protein [Enterobacter sp. ECC-019]|uniref:hypothetical protein n=1 Tax=Enterobacter sp. ECC-019 TaxID=3116478 RepID=UPI003754599A
MTYSQERNKKMHSLLYKQRVLLEHTGKSSVFISNDSHKYYTNLLEYIEGDLERNIYTIPVLRKAIKTDSYEHLLKVVQFFSSNTSCLFDVKYCYELENMEYEDIQADEYTNYILYGTEPVTANGSEIEDFNPKYLSFYCIINMD